MDKHRIGKSIQVRILLINSIMTGLVLALLITSSSYLIAKVKKSQIDMTNSMAKTLAYNIEEELFFLNKLMSLCKSDSDFILCMTSPFQDYKYYERCKIAQEKLGIIKCLIPYADNVYLYITNKNKILHAEKGIFDNNSRFIRLPQNKENKTFYRENDRVIYSIPIQNYGTIYIEINEKKFIDSLIQPNEMEKIMYFILDHENQILFDSAELEKIDISLLQEGKQIVDNEEYYMIKENMRFLNYTLFLFKSVNEIEKVIIRMNAIFIMIILGGVIIGGVLITLNRRMYLPMQNLIQKYTGQIKRENIAANEFDIIEQIIENLINENSLEESVENKEVDIYPIYEDIYIQCMINNTSQISEELTLFLDKQYLNHYIVLMTAEKKDGKVNHELLEKINKKISYKKYIECENGIHMYIMGKEKEYNLLLEQIANLENEWSMNTEIYISQKFCIKESRQIKYIFEEAKSSLIRYGKIESKEEYIFINFEEQKSIINSVVNKSEKEIEQILSTLLLTDKIEINNARENFKILVYLLKALIKKINSDKEKMLMKSFEVKESFNKNYMFSSLLEDYKTINGFYSLSKDSLKSQIIEYINKNFSENLSLDAIADYFGITSQYLSAYFKKNTGLNISNYIVEVRMEEAKKMLWGNKNIKIAEVAERVGIYSQATFIRHFKNNTGVSPSEYRRKMQQDILCSNYKLINKENEDE